MDGWINGEIGTLRSHREFPLKETETLNRQTLFLETPPQHPSPQPSCGLPVFRDGGTSSGLSVRAGDAFGSAGIPGGGGRVQWGSLWRLPSPRGGSLFPSFATLEAGWLLPLFSLLFVVPEVREEELSLELPTPQRVPKLLGN